MKIGTLYAESSAVVSWLLDEAPAPSIGEVLAQAERVLASELTLVECDRVLIRAEAQERLTREAIEENQELLHSVAKFWDIVVLDEPILNRVRKPFPIEPIKTLDALHLASAEAVRSSYPDLVLLSLDKKVRACARELGFEIFPEDRGHPATADPEA